MDSIKYWDSVAGSKEFTLEFEVDKFISELPDFANVLDVGCGYGRSMLQLHKAGVKNLSGCDTSPKMIEQAKQNLPDAEFKVNKGIKLPFADDSFEAVVLLAVLTSIIDNQQQAKLLNEISRVLTDNGLIYVGDFLLNEDQRNLDRYEKGLKANNTYGVFELDEGAIMRHHDPDYIAALLGGFFAVDFQFVTHKTMNGNTSNGFFFLGENCK
jgi:SAM-dependent methyltransferase